MTHDTAPFALYLKFAAENAAKSILEDWFGWLRLGLMTAATAVMMVHEFGTGPIDAWSDTVRVQAARHPWGIPVAVALMATRFGSATTNVVRRRLSQGWVLTLPLSRSGTRTLMLAATVVVAIATAAVGLLVAGTVGLLASGAARIWLIPAILGAAVVPAWVSFHGDLGWFHRAPARDRFAAQASPAWLDATLHIVDRSRIRHLSRWMLLGGKPGDSPTYRVLAVGGLGSGVLIAVSARVALALDSGLPLGLSGGLVAIFLFATAIHSGSAVADTLAPMGVPWRSAAGGMARVAVTTGLVTLAAVSALAWILLDAEAAATAGLAGLGLALVVGSLHPLLMFCLLGRPELLSLAYWITLTLMLLWLGAFPVLGAVAGIAGLAVLILIAHRRWRDHEVH